MNNGEVSPLLGIIGAGVMGIGIATLAVGHGFSVVLVDVDDAALTQAAAAVPRELRLAQLIGKLPKDHARGSFRTTTSIEDVAGVAAVIESVIEVPTAKAAVFRQVSAVVRPGTPIASNTSAIPIDELAGHAQRPADVLGTHFMNPPYLIRMVEVIRGRRTSDAVLAVTGELLTALDRQAVIVADGPGFVINRVLQRMINDSARIVEQGLATIETVDMLFKGCLGHTTGPLATADLIGLDNVVDTLRVLYERTGDASYRPCELLAAKVRAGAFGRKTGHGFYTYR